LTTCWNSETIETKIRRKTLNLKKKGFIAFCVIVISMIGLSGCSGKYLLVLGREDMTEGDYLKAKEACIQLTNGASYSKRFRFAPIVAPKDAPRTNVYSSYAQCMEAKGLVCINCERQKPFAVQP
jgi:hypothetical protein